MVIAGTEDGSVRRKVAPGVVRGSPEPFLTARKRVIMLIHEHVNKREEGRRKRRKLKAVEPLFDSNLLLSSGI
jgi:hypothetical protein